MSAPPGVATLYRTAAALMVLLALTVGLGRLDLGAASFPIALAIAAVKAALVAAFFMELKWSDATSRSMALLSLAWLVLLLAGTLADVRTR